MSMPRIFIGLFIAVAAGTAAALFLNSEKGKEIIDDLKESANDASDKIKRHLSDLENEVLGLVKKGKNILEALENGVAETLTD